MFLEHDHLSLAHFVWILIHSPMASVHPVYSQLFLLKPQSPRGLHFFFIETIVTYGVFHSWVSDIHEITFGDKSFLEAIAGKSGPTMVVLIPRTVALVRRKATMSTLSLPLSLSFAQPLSHNCLSCTKFLL